MTKIDRDSQNIVKLLKKKGRASAAELGTDGPTMKILEDAGVVKPNGIVKTGKRGRPPVAYEVVKSADLSDLPEIEEPTKRDSENAGISQVQIDKVIRQVKHDEYNPGCTCIQEGHDLVDLRLLNSGCTERWVCSNLDAVRRILGYGVRANPQQIHDRKKAIIDGERTHSNYPNVKWL